MKKSWAQYYKKHKKINIVNIFLHWSYLLAIIAQRPKNILEVGCGPADHSLFLSSFFVQIRISLLDFDENIVNKLKRKASKKIKNIFLCDLTKKQELKKELKSSKYDVIYSQGLMEHFERKEFIKIIENLMNYTNKYIFSIPSENYPTIDFGNEKLRNKKELESILKETPNITYKVENYFPDIGIRTKLLKIKKNKLVLTQSLLFLIFGSCHYLIKIQKSNTRL